MNVLEIGLGEKEKRLQLTQERNSQRKNEMGQTVGAEHKRTVKTRKWGQSSQKTQRMETINI